MELSFNFVSLGAPSGVRVSIALIVLKTVRAAQAFGEPAEIPCLEQMKIAGNLDRRRLFLWLFRVRWSHGRGE